MGLAAYTVSNVGSTVFLTLGLPVYLASFNLNVLLNRAGRQLFV